MTDDDPEADSEVVVDRESVRVRFTASKEWVEEELLPRYPAVTSLSQAARQAAMDGVECRADGNGVRASIDSDVIDALRELGGSVENCQTVRINSANEVVVEESDEVDVADGE